MISRENAEHYTWGEGCDGWHLSKSQALSVIHERVPFGSSEVRHFHNKAEQFFFVLSGIATLEVESDIYQLQRFQGFQVKAGLAHTLTNQNKEDLELLVISTPPSHGDRVNVE